MSTRVPTTIGELERLCLIAALDVEAAIAEQHEPAKIRALYADLVRLRARRRWLRFLDRKEGSS